MGRQDETRPPLGLVAIRIATGLVLLVHGWRWIASGELDGGEVRHYVDRALDDLSGPLALWGDRVVLANPDAFAFLWRWVALLAGVALTFGALTRPAGAVAAVLLLHGIVYGPDVDGLLYGVLLVSCAGCAAARAGRRVGLDSIFDQHFPSWLTWTRHRRGFLP